MKLKICISFVLLSFVNLAYSASDNDTKNIVGGLAATGAIGVIALGGAAAFAAKHKLDEKKRENKTVEPGSMDDIVHKTRAENARAVEKSVEEHNETYSNIKGLITLEAGKDPKTMKQVSHKMRALERLMENAQKRKPTPTELHQELSKLKITSFTTSSEHMRKLIEAHNTHIERLQKPIESRAWVK